MPSNHPVGTLECRQLLSAYGIIRPGDLDTTFSVGGEVVSGLSQVRGGGADAVQADGAIVVASTGVSGGHEALVVSRFNPDGSLDAGFGTGGVLF